MRECIAAETNLSSSTPEWASEQEQRRANFRSYRLDVAKHGTWSSKPPRVASRDPFCTMLEFVVFSDWIKEAELRPRL